MRFCIKLCLNETLKYIDDIFSGMFIPRGPRSEFSNPAFFDPVSQQQKVRNILQRHFSQFIADEKVDMNTKINDFIANCVSYKKSLFKRCS